MEQLIAKAFTSSSFTFSFALRAFLGNISKSENVLKKKLTSVLGCKEFSFPPHMSRYTRYYLLVDYFIIYSYVSQLAVSSCFILRLVAKFSFSTPSFSYRVSFTCARPHRETTSDTSDS